MRVRLPGPSANAETKELARRVAEAQIDLRRVRYARHKLLSDALADPHYDSWRGKRKKMAVLRGLLRKNAPDLPVENVVAFLNSTPQGPHKFATILSQEAKQLLAMDRYERRALSRRKSAIRAFDATSDGGSIAIIEWTTFSVKRTRTTNSESSCTAIWQNEPKFLNDYMEGVEERRVDFEHEPVGDCCDVGIAAATSASPSAQRTPTPEQ